MKNRKFESPEMTVVLFENDIIETSTDVTEVLVPTTCCFIPIDDFTS